MNMSNYKEKNNAFNSKEISKKNLDFALSFIFKWSIIALLITLTLGGWNLKANTVLEQDALCEAAIKNTSLRDLSGIFRSNVVEQCKKSPIDRDLSVQIMIISLGEPMYYILEIGRALGFFVHELKKDSPEISMLKPVHDTLGAFNWLMFKTLTFLIFLMFFVQLIRWSRAEANVGFMKWLNRGFTQNAVSVSLSMPVLGWMTPIQVIAATFVVIVVYFTKYAVTLFFAGLFVADTAGNLYEDVKDSIGTNLVNTTLVYTCDIFRRESLIESVIAADRISNQTDLENNQVYTCLMGDGQTTVETTPSIGGQTAYENYNVLLAALDNYDRCVMSNMEYLSQRGIKPNDVNCGRTILQIPVDVKDKEKVRNAYSNVFLASSVQNELRQVAITMHEYYCRYNAISRERDFGQFSARCGKLNISSAGYSFDFILDEIAQERVIGRHISAMGDHFKQETKERSAIAINSLSNKISSEQESLAEVLRSLIKNNNDHSELPTNEKDVKDLANKMGKGAWMISSIFLEKTAKNLEDMTIVNALREAYRSPRVEMKELSKALNPSGATSVFISINKIPEIIGTFTSYLETSGRSSTMILANAAKETSVGQWANRNIGFSLLPEIDIYTSQLKCWSNQMECNEIPLNPFIYIGKEGVRILDHAMVRFIAASVIKLGSHQITRITGVRSDLMVISVYAEFSALYVFIGLIMAIIIPLYPLLKVISLSVKWGLEIVKELIGLQLSLAFVPFSEPSKKVISDDIRKALSRLTALSLYFLFIILGVVIMFLAFSFLFALNVFLMGGLATVFQFAGEGNFLESMFTQIVFDVVIAILLFIQVRACTDLIEQIPETLAERFSLDLSRTEDITGMIIRQFRTNITPGVSRFMSHVR